MCKEHILTAIQDAFQIPRPQSFIRGTCHCEECLEHEAVMQAFESEDMSLDKLNSPSWDPVCFASNEAFHYLLPGLARLALNYPDAYVAQFLFHLQQPERLDSLSPRRAQALLPLLDYLVDQESASLENSRLVDDLFRVREWLEEISGTS